MAKVVLENVYKRFGEAEIVKDFNLEIHDEEMIVLVGPSGCGKSTTLRMIAGLEGITSGQVYVGDRVVNDLTPKERDIAMVFQNYALYPHMNVYDNMAFSLKIKKMPKAEIDQKVRETARILQIEHLLARKPKALSGGQRQRVAMGRAIVREPAVFLMDEPLSNLDAKLRGSMRAEVLRLHQRLKTTTIYVTHDQTEAMTMGDRIVVMKDGVIQQVDTPMNLYSSPKNLFVAGFIGNPPMNFMKAVLTRENDELYLAGAGFKVLIPRGKISDMPGCNREVIFGIRPEHIHDEGIMLDTFPQARFIATVEVVELLGADVLLHLSLNGQEIRASLPARNTYRAGEAVTMVFDMNKMHLFDPVSELACAGD
ncbi:Maltodextrin import ATP-binding protein MsmX [Propionispora sp. 2/2-37]|uniref:ABC transporter ATP-binding protein n=1 Tax=Propionispora sp. 2/2-37 TaxID=1677858 RepID=UPI0006BB5776|nr:sn-glycerol-3-phosphate ABC transporter ATP-binding protein UgpC [Propionispora sp. 2/2-37]CUH96759.1 Maltodextrin import ATP-binding protein MsmX [Propionispora sp. 2/2-37]